MKTAFVAKERQGHSLKTAVYAVSTLGSADIKAMYALMQSYYELADYNDFLSDLRAKDDVIILRESWSGKLVGFSTLRYFHLNNAGQKAIGVFSGDTIVEERYWGCTALQKCFLIQLCKLKFRHSGAKLYWFLISKGYKTYLLMANNFPLHYPRVEAETPLMHKDMMAQVYRELYPKAYDAENDLIHNIGDSYRLKNGVAAPTQELIKTLKRVGYFVAKNPQWQKGDELACIAEMDYSVLVSYLGKSVKKTLGMRSASMKRA